MRSRLNARSRRQRGALLVEALIAIAVLGVGIAGVAGILKLIQDTNSRMDFQTHALELNAAFTAQVRAASCDFFPQAPVADRLRLDAGLVAGTYVAPAASSMIQLVGEFSEASPPIRAADPTRTVVRIRYQSFALAQPALGPPSFDVLVQIREITRDPAKDAVAVTDGYWIRTFVIKKVCNVRYEDPGRGRGEYY